MAFKALMTPMQLGRSNAGLLQLVASLAERWQASVTGVAACQPMQLIYGEGCYVSADLIQLDRDNTEREMAAAEAEFRHGLEACSSRLHWRCAVIYQPLSEYIAAEARCADLIVTSSVSAKAEDSSRRVNLGDLVMQAGRPVLVVPEAATAPALGRVMLAWKDTREARRAAADALPLLQAAHDVTVLEIADQDAMADARAHLVDVVGWLGRHGVAATSVASQSTGDDAARLNDMAREDRVDLLVAGAYGHSRLREWALGGVTRDILSHPTRCALLSH